MIDVPLKVLHKIGVRVIGDNDVLRSVDGTDETGETGARAELEDSLATNERVCVVFKVGCQRAARVPEEMTLLGDMSTLDENTL
jgi:hypothetical protein